MKKKMSIIIAGILFLAGLSLLLYPLVANQWNTYRQSRLISEYETTVSTENSEGAIDYEKEWEKANAYNAALLPSILPDSFAIAAASDEPGDEYMSCLNILNDGMMGYVEVPKINIKIPIFHTTSEEVLNKGAGHLEGSSLPVGGENTHAVISAHRGLPQCKPVYGSGSVRKRRSFPDFRIGSETLLQSGSDPHRRTGRYRRSGGGAGRRSCDTAYLYTLRSKYSETSGKRTPGTV